MRIVGSPAARDAAFWVAMGPHFADKERRKELPALYDLPGRVWFLALDTTGTLIAFASLDVEKGVGHLRNLYVHPDRRGQQMASLLMRERLAYLREQGVTTARTSRRVSKEVHFAENHGFTILRVEAGWEILEADLTTAVAADPEPSDGAETSEPDAAPARTEEQEKAYQAGRKAATEAMAKRMREVKKTTRAVPTTKQFETWRGPLSDHFLQGWKDVIAAEYRAITTWDGAGRLTPETAPTPKSTSRRSRATEAAA